MPRMQGRSRPEGIPVMVSKAEKKELLKAADQAGMALSVYVRVTALEAARLRVLDREQRRRRVRAFSDLAANDRDRL
jgi:hypothetical protein